MPVSTMRSKPTHAANHSPCAAQRAAGEDAGAAEALLAPLLERCARPGTRLRHASLGEFHHGTRRHTLPHFLFQGPPDGGSPVRLGWFAAIHGDEPEGAVALRDFLLALDDDPTPAQGYELHVYPVCNPGGLACQTRHSPAGCDLNREFWRESTQPEVRLLERELAARHFHGLVALHSDDTADGAYAFVRGATLTKALAKPALAAASRFLPLASGTTIDGFPARQSLIRRCYEGILCHPVELRPLPFEIIFETPQSFPAPQQTAAAVAALQAILHEYRQFIAYGQNL